MSFIENFTKKVTGENVEMIAKKVQKRALTSIAIEISATENDILRIEDELEAAKENYKDAILNYGKETLNTEDYIEKIFTSYNNVQTIEENLSEKRGILKALNKIKSEICK